MNFRFLALSALLGLSSAASLAAPVTTVDFSDLNATTNLKAVASVTEDEFIVRNDCAGLKLLGKPLSNCLMSKTSGSGKNKNTVAYNNYANSSNSVGRVDGQAFNFDSIDLDDMNNISGLLADVFSDYTIDFSFSYVDGSSAKKTVNLDRKNGLQTFALKEQNLLSASWVSSKGLYFDNLKTSDVPEPASLTLTLMALAGLAYSRRKSNNSQRG